MASFELALKNYSFVLYTDVLVFSMQSSMFVFCLFERAVSFPFASSSSLSDSASVSRTPAGTRDIFAVALIAFITCGLSREGAASSID